MFHHVSVSDPCLCLLDKELGLFCEEYEHFFLEGETKPRTIGEPYLLDNPGATHGVLLIHGFMAAPEEVRQWAEFLHGGGYTVYVPRLPGHGTSAPDLARRSFSEWVDSVDRGRAILGLCCQKMIVAGFSTGAGLALHQALNHPSSYEAVVSVSAPFKFKGFSSRLAEPVNAWNHFLRMFGINRWQKEFVPNHPDNPEINYHRCPIHGIVQVKALMAEVKRLLPTLSIPSLIIQGSRDPKVDSSSGRKIFDRIGFADKKYREIDFHLHGIVRGPIARTVFAEVEAFLNRLPG